MSVSSTIRKWRSSAYKFLFAMFLNVYSKVYNRAFHDRKKELFSHIHDLNTQSDKPIELLEIGAGTGSNFRYYPNGCHVTCLDPNPHVAGYSRRGHVGLVVNEPVVGMAEDMSSVRDNSVDVVVSTIVMCSVSDVDRSLAEVKRILRPVRE